MNDLEYWTTVAEIDCIYWQLEEMLKAERSLTAFERMIDEATGFDQKKLKTAKALVARAKKLRARIEA